MRWTVLILVLFSACSKPAEEAKPEAKPIEPPKVELPPQPSATPAQARRQNEAATEVRTMMGKMQAEAAHRPKVGVTAEQLFDALEEKVGIKLDERQQYMGATMHASFCAGGIMGSDHVTIAMCEYPDDKTAQESLELMNKYFTVKGAHRVAHRAAVMTIIDPNDGDPRIAKALATFQSL